MRDFKLEAPYKPMGDQINAIDKLTSGIRNKKRYQTLLGITGSGKTFVIANVIEKIKKPTLVISHNKTLAAQLYQEFKEYFPNNAVEYFVSYYDYYQPEAYLPVTDRYIEKDFSLNEEIDRLRNAATRSLMERDDVIIIASVSCIYGLGSPEYYKSMKRIVEKGDIIKKKDFFKHLIEIRYERNDVDFKPGKFRSRGDTIDIFPIYEESLFTRIELFGDEIDRITKRDIVTGDIELELTRTLIYPAGHYVQPRERLNESIKDIELELEERLAEFRKENKLLEAQRLEQRTKYDLEMIRHLGFCKGIENYSRHFDNRETGEPPYVLLDYLPEDYLLVIDESHMTIPQVKGMRAGDFSRKTTLVDYGFRLPSAIDNRPLSFAEFEQRMGFTVFVSATPADYEKKLCGKSNIVEQIIRPTGLIDPEIIVKMKLEHQIDDLVDEMRITIDKNERILVTTLTKRMAENLTDYLEELGFRVRYMHSEIKTLERSDLIRGLRLGEFDILVGINLLREGLDLPEVSMVAILDADKQGFLRDERALIQTIGRAARNVNGRVLFYADIVTPAMESAIRITKSRRRRQINYNKEMGIEPQTIVKEIRSPLVDLKKSFTQFTKQDEIPDIEELPSYIIALKEEMGLAAKNLEFEKAAEIRDLIFSLEKNLDKSDADDIL